jgi:hypothetical protein
MPVESQAQLKEEELAIDAFAKVVWSAFLAERNKQNGLQTIPPEQGEPRSDGGLCEISISKSQTNLSKVLPRTMPIQPP